MDNLTHTGIGALVARTLEPHIKGEHASQGKRSIFWASVLANNAPDLDFILGPLFEDRKLGYLIHHRGVTHTFLAVPLLMVFVALIVERLFLKDPGVRRVMRPWVWFVCALGGLLHIGADFLNDYGVHPFTPFENSWFYGGRIFIIEPLLWCAVFPFLIKRATHWLERLIWAFGICGGIGLAARVGVPLVTLSWAVSALGLSVFQELIFSRRLLVWMKFGTLLLLFTAKGTQARITVETFLGASVDHLEVSSSPAPMNPFCWRILASFRDRRDQTYRAWVGVVSLLPRPKWGLDAVSCYVFSKQGLVGQAQLEERVRADRLWAYEYRGDPEIEKRLLGGSCRFDRLLRFVRFPFFDQISKKEERYRVGDLRYDRPGRGGFTTFEISLPDTECESFGDSIFGGRFSKLRSPARSLLNTASP